MAAPVTVAGPVPVVLSSGQEVIQFENAFKWKPFPDHEANVEVIYGDTAFHLHSDVVCLSSKYMATQFSNEAEAATVTGANSTGTGTPSDSLDTVGTSSSLKGPDQERKMISIPLPSKASKLLSYPFCEKEVDISVDNVHTLFAIMYARLSGIMCGPPIEDDNVRAVAYLAHLLDMPGIEAQLEPELISRVDSWVKEIRYYGDGCYGKGTNPYEMIVFGQTIQRNDLQSRCVQALVSEKGFRRAQKQIGDRFDQVFERLNAQNAQQLLRKTQNLC